MATTDDNGTDAIEKILAEYLQQNPSIRDWALKEYVSAKVQSKHITNYNGANLALNHALDVANRLGLSDAQKGMITPFPSPTNLNFIVGGGESKTEREISTQTAPPTGNKTTPTWRRWLLPLALGAGGLAGGAMLHDYLTDDPPTAEPPNSEVGFTIK